MMKMSVENGGKRPLLSIVTVCLNSEQTIASTMQSVLDQNCLDYEYLVCDGGSKDNTLNIIRDYSKKFHDKGIHFAWSSKPDDGIYNAMNNGIAVAKGQVVGIINSDDSYERGAFLAVKGSCRRNPKAAVYYGFLRMLYKGRELSVVRYNFDTFLLDLNSGVFSSCQHPSCFVQRWVYEKIGSFDTQFTIAADYDFLVRVAKAGLHFETVDAVLANFARGGVSDQMSDHTRFEQRYRIWLKNGLVGDGEYLRLMRQTRYTYLKELKLRIVRKMFGFS